MHFRPVPSPGSRPGLSPASRIFARFSPFLGHWMAAGCLGPSPSPLPTLEPHAVGNEWFYAYPDGQTETTLFISARQSVVLEGGETIPVYTVQEGFFQVPRFATNGPEGLYTVHRMTEDGPYRRLLHLKHPAEIGETWTATYPIHDPGAGLEEVPESFSSLAFTFVAQDQPVETPAGTFRCSVYRIRYASSGGGEPLYVFRYFAPGIGLVAESLLSPDSTMGDPQQSDLIVLRQYRLN